MRCFFLVVVPLVCLGAAPAEAKKKGPSAVAVKKAIDAGAGWLMSEFSDGFEAETFHSTPELVALTLNHAGISPKDKTFKKCMKVIETCDLLFTYRVATLAMALSKINPYKYRSRLAHCAQWLVDTQLPGGDWGYPGRVGGRGEDATRALKTKPPEIKKPVKPVRPGREEPLVIVRATDPAKVAEAIGDEHGDFSNTQFALLGLRACRDARIVIPKETWQSALDYMVKCQQEDGSWGYDQGGEQDMSGYASLTCAGIVGVAICAHGLKKSHKSHPAVKKGLAWLKKKWEPDRNVDVENSTFVLPTSWQTYQLYSVERVGRVLGLKKIGKRKWYDEGAQWLLDNQSGDGSWKDPAGDASGGAQPYLKVADTCFAILFLTLATPPLTGG